jgi:antitoxin component of RelBE/YafQ-DinJ toxin-antitoxin module
MKNNIFNFRCNPSTKLKFQQICKENHLGMTSILNSFISEFVEKYEPSNNKRL